VKLTDTVLVRLVGLPKGGRETLDVEDLDDELLVAARFWQRKFVPLVTQTMPASQQADPQVTGGAKQATAPLHTCVPLVEVQVSPVLQHPPSVHAISPVEQHIPSVVQGPPVLQHPPLEHVAIHCRF
jgi:hypothetical protein